MALFNCYRVLSGSWDKSVCLWDIETETKLVSHHVYNVYYTILFIYFKCLPMDFLIQESMLVIASAMIPFSGHRCMTVW